MSDPNQDLINERTKKLLTINNSKYKDIINDLNKYYKKISDDIDSWNSAKGKYMNRSDLINNIKTKNKFEGVSAEYLDDKFPESIKEIDTIFSKAKDILNDISAQIRRLESKIKANQAEITKINNSN